jgi:hypothetical protein
MSGIAGAATPPPYPPPQAGEGKSKYPPPRAGEGREGATGEEHAGRTEV